MPLSRRDQSFNLIEFVRRYQPPIRKVLYGVAGIIWNDSIYCAYNKNSCIGYDFYFIIMKDMEHLTKQNIPESPE